jgi:hypothetical protein
MATSLSYYKTLASSSVPTSGVASFLVRDPNLNVTINNVSEAFATTVSSASPITLTVASAPIQQITGSTAQTMNLPSCLTTVTGMQFQFFNRSSANLTIKDGGGNVIQLMIPYSQLIVTCAAIGTVAGTWDISYVPVGTSAGGLNYTYQYSAPLTGATVTMTQAYLLINPAGTIAALTIVLPASPVPGQVACFATSQTITALTITGAIDTTLTTLAAGGKATFMYELNSAKWFQIA